MQVTAKVDYAVRALLELAASPDDLVTRDDLADAQQIPARYLEAVLGQLRQAGLIVGQRGSSGGYRLCREPADISIADVSRAVDGPLALVQGQRPEALHYTGTSEHLADLWVGMRGALRSVMESVSVADVLAGDWPAEVQSYVDDPAAWRPR